MGQQSTTSPAASADLVAQLERIRGPLGSFVCALIGDARQAREIVEEALAQALRAAQHGGLPSQGDAGEVALRHWLLCRAYRHAVSVRRFEVRDAPLPMALASLPDRPYQPIPFDDQLAEGEILRTALATLGPQDAACLLLNVVYAFSVGQIASMLEMAPAAVRKRLIIAKRHLRDAYFADHANQK